MNKQQQKAFEAWFEKTRVTLRISQQQPTPIGWAEMAAEWAFNYAKKGGSDEGFAEFWTRYPKKVKKKESLKVWKRDNLSAKQDIIIADLSKRKNDESWKSGYIPDPTTYLNGERWEDEIKTKAVIVVLPKSDSEWIKKGEQLRCQPRPGESMFDYKHRIGLMLNAVP